MSLKFDGYIYNPGQLIIICKIILCKIGVLGVSGLLNMPCAI